MLPFSTRDWGPSRVELVLVDFTKETGHPQILLRRALETLNDSNEHIIFPTENDMQIR